MVSFGETGTGSLGTAPAESDDCRAATAQRWVAGGEEVGSSADRHPTAQKKECRGAEHENRWAGSPAGTAALNVATAPVKKLQASLRRDHNREHDEYKILLDCVLRASVARQGFTLDSSPRWLFLPAADPIGGDDRLGDAEYYRCYFPTGEPNRANMKTSAESSTSA